MQSLWTRFEAWLAENWPEGLADLNPPATDAQIDSLEKAIGAKLPDDYIACLKIHNGQDTMMAGVFGGSEFLSTEFVLDEWAVWKELIESGTFEGNQGVPDSGIKDNWWNPRWIPFTHNGGGDHFCLDLDPAKGGSPGQVITMWHDSGERAFIATNFTAWFTQYVDKVVAGKYVYSEDYGGLIDSEDAQAAG